MLKDKVILITGASSGLGFALLKKAIEEGAKVALCARDISNLNQLLHKDIFIAECDVTKEEEVFNFINKVIEKFGGIDIVIANAGQSMWSRFCDINSLNDLLGLINVNYFGVVNFLFYSLEMLKKNRGSFVAISSIQGVLPAPYHSGYVASKHAVNGLIESVRMEEPDINFLLVCPGWISGTHLRSQALKSSKPGAIKVRLSHKSNAISREEASELIFQAIKKQKKYLFIPKYFKYLALLRYLFRNLMDKIIQYKVNKQLF